jgi:hypothetical protein
MSSVTEEVMCRAAEHVRARGWSLVFVETVDQDSELQNDLEDLELEKCRELSPGVSLMVRLGPRALSGRPAGVAPRALAAAEMEAVREAFPEIAQRLAFAYPVDHNAPTASHARLSLTISSLSSDNQISDPDRVARQFMSLVLALDGDPEREAAVRAALGDENLSYFVPSGVTPAVLRTLFSSERGAVVVMGADDNYNNDDNDGSEDRALDRRYVDLARRRWAGSMKAKVESLELPTAAEGDGQAIFATLARSLDAVMDSFESVPVPTVDREHFTHIELAEAMVAQMVGRSHEVDAVLEAMQSCPVLALQAPPGYGKAHVLAKVVHVLTHPQGQQQQNQAAAAADPLVTTSEDLLPLLPPPQPSTPLPPPAPPPKVVVRFIGATPRSCKTLSFLKDLYHSLRVAVGQVSRITTTTGRNPSRSPSPSPSPNSPNLRRSPSSSSSSSSEESPDENSPHGPSNASSEHPLGQSAAEVAKKIRSLLETEPRDPLLLVLVGLDRFPSLTSNDEVSSLSFLPPQPAANVSVVFSSDSSLFSETLGKHFTLLQRPNRYPGASSGSTTPASSHNNSSNNQQQHQPQVHQTLLWTMELAGLPHFEILLMLEAELARMGRALPEQRRDAVARALPKWPSPLTVVLSAQRFKGWTRDGAPAAAAGTDTSLSSHAELIEERLVNLERVCGPMFGELAAMLACVEEAGLCGVSEPDLVRLWPQLLERRSNHATRTLSGTQVGTLSGSKSQELQDPPSAGPSGLRVPDAEEVLMPAALASILQMTSSVVRPFVASGQLLYRLSHPLIAAAVRARYQVFQIDRDSMHTLLADYFLEAAEETRVVGEDAQPAAKPAAAAAGEQQAATFVVLSSAPALPARVLDAEACELLFCASVAHRSLSNDWVSLEAALTNLHTLSRRLAICRSFSLHNIASEYASALFLARRSGQSLHILETLLEYVGDAPPAGDVLYPWKPISDKSQLMASLKDIRHRGCEVLHYADGSVPDPKAGLHPSSSIFNLAKLDNQQGDAKQPQTPVQQPADPSPPAPHARPFTEIGWYSCGTRFASGPAPPSPVHLWSVSPRNGSRYIHRVPAVVKPNIHVTRALRGGKPKVMAASSPLTRDQSAPIPVTAFSPPEPEPYRLMRESGLFDTVLKSIFEVQVGANEAGRGRAAAETPALGGRSSVASTVVKQSDSAINLSNFL